MRADAKCPTIDTTSTHSTALGSKAMFARDMGTSSLSIDFRLSATDGSPSYFLNDIDLAQADTSFWSMTRKEIEEMDPQQRLALEVVYECLQNSGTTKFKNKNIGCYFGIFGEVRCQVNLISTC
jgi:hypothetical protein